MSTFNTKNKMVITYSMPSVLECFKWLYWALRHYFYKDIVHLILDVSKDKYSYNIWYLIYKYGHDYNIMNTKYEPPIFVKINISETFVNMRPNKTKITLDICREAEGFNKRIIRKIFSYNQFIEGVIIINDKYNLLMHTQYGEEYDNKNTEATNFNDPQLLIDYYLECQNKYN